jgi:hypothetical protein
MENETGHSIVFSLESSEIPVADYKSVGCLLQSPFPDKEDYYFPPPF